MRQYSNFGKKQITHEIKRGENKEKRGGKEERCENEEKEGK